MCFSCHFPPISSLYKRFQMMRWRHKWKLIVFVLFVYCSSMPFFNKLLKWNNIGEVKHKSIVWNLRTTLNLLSPQITSPDDVSNVGWWMDHSQCKEEIECNTHKWTLCSRALSCSCSPEKVRAVFQYVPLKETLGLKGLDFSLTASSDINEENARALLGAVVLVKLNNSAMETFRINLTPPIKPHSDHKTAYQAPPLTSIISATVMLICHGYSGNVKYSNMILLPRSNLSDFNQVVDYCKKKSINRKSKSFKKESIQLKYKENVAIGDVTLTTHLSMDRISTLERTIGVWKGVVSLVIFVPQKGDEEEGDTQWQKIYIQKKMKSLNFYVGSKAYLVFGHPDQHEYPINYLRNLALNNCETKFCFITDADFQPSPDFLIKFNSALKSMTNISKTAFVVPAFEYTELPLKRDSIPQTKEELMQLLHTKEPFVQPFRLSNSPESHRLTNYYAWYRASRAYPVHTFNDKYEPYLLMLNQNVHRFDQRFTGYGMNKITFITQLFAAGWRFMVLPDLWIIHLPHKYTPYAADFLQNPYQRLKNRFDRFEFVEELTSKYRINECSKHI